MWTADHINAPGWLASWHKCTNCMWQDICSKCRSSREGSKYIQASLTQIPKCLGAALNNSERPLPALEWASWAALTALNLLNWVLFWCFCFPKKKTQLGLAMISYPCDAPCCVWPKFCVLFAAWGWVPNNYNLLIFFYSFLPHLQLQQTPELPKEKTDIF